MLNHFPFAHTCPLPQPFQRNPQRRYPERADVSKSDASDMDMRKSSDTAVNNLSPMVGMWSSWSMAFGTGWVDIYRCWSCRREGCRAGSKWVVTSLFGCGHFPSCADQHAAIPDSIDSGRDIPHCIEFHLSVQSKVSRYCKLYYCTFVTIWTAICITAFRNLGYAVNMKSMVGIRMHCTYNTLFGDLPPASEIKYISDKLASLTMNRVEKVKETNVCIFDNCLTRRVNIVKWTMFYFELFAKVGRYRLPLQRFPKKSVMILTTKKQPVGEHNEYSLIRQIFVISWAEYH